MAIETERKFLVRDDTWRSAVTSSISIRQGYIASAPGRSVRLRLAGETAWLTLKFGDAALRREEFEYPIPVADADAMLVHASNQIVKERHIVPWQDLRFEVDVFSGSLNGLVLAELETERVINSSLLPEWLGPEVTGDARYYNVVLALQGIPKPIDRS